MSANTVTIIGPEDHGRTMTLDEFERAEAREGWFYELGRGVVVVNEVPNPWHFCVVDEIRTQLTAYRLGRPDRIRRIGGPDGKVLLDEFQSERHPDVLVYATEPPGNDSRTWAEWIPELVVEVVTPGSRYRDFEEKPDEYLHFGVLEYWIVDPENDVLVALRRSGGAWKRNEVRPPAVYETPLYPGLKLDTAPVFTAADPR